MLATQKHQAEVGIQRIRAWVTDRINVGSFKATPSAATHPVNDFVFKIHGDRLPEPATLHLTSEEVRAARCRWPTGCNSTGRATPMQ